MYGLDENVASTVLRIFHHDPQIGHQDKPLVGNAQRDFSYRIPAFGGEEEQTSFGASTGIPVHIT